MDLTAANAFLFLLTLLLVSFIGWFVLKDNTVEKENVKETFPRPGDVKETEILLDQPPSPTTTATSSNSTSKEQDVEISQDTRGEDNSDSLHPTAVINTLTTPVDSNNQTESQESTSEIFCDKETTPILTTLNSLDEMESEIQEAADEQMRSKDKEPTTEQGEDWIVL